MPGKHPWAKWIRILTVPPLPAAALVCMLAVRRSDIFIGKWDFGVSLFFLSVFPMLAYPATRIIPSAWCKGREGERRLAFLFALAGYAVLYLYGICGFRRMVDQRLVFVFASYFFSTLLLTGANALFHVRASGHACGTLGPMLLAGTLMGWQWMLPFLLAFLLSLWASLAMERHTPQECFLGGVCCTGGFVTGLLQLIVLNTFF